MMSEKMQIDEARTWWLVILAVVAWGFVCCVPVQAQFVCAGSSDGAAPLTGQGAEATGSTANVACGFAAGADGNGGANTAVGTFASAQGDNGLNVAVGTFSFADGNNSGNTASGSFADAHGENSDNTASGFVAKAFGAGSANTATGFKANASGNASFNTATGRTANAMGDNSDNTATGVSADAHGNTSANTATGVNANASGDNSDNTATGPSAFAFGSSSSNVAMGNSAVASGNGSSNIAIGDHSDARGDNSNNIAIGANSRAASNSVAFGTGAQAAFVNSAAFGNGAVATRANQQVFGSLSNTYTLPGLPLAASNAAQSGATKVVTTDGFGNLGTMPFTSLGLASASDLATLSVSVDQLSRRVSKANTGVAMAFAMAGVPTLLPNEKFAFTTNWGTFQGENGAALSGAVRIYRNVQLQGSFAYGLRENMAGGHAGLRFGF